MVGSPWAARQLAGACLAGEPLEDRRRRPDEGQAVCRHDLGEALVLGQEAVARVDRVAAGDERRRDDRRRRQVRAAGLGRADADRLVGQLDRERVAVRLAVGDDRLGAEGPACPQDPEGDLAAVGDEDLAEHDQASGAPADGELEQDQLLAVLDRVAGLDQAGADDAVGRCDDLLRDPEHVDRAEPVAGPDPGARPGPPARGWKIPTAGEVADDPPVRRGRRPRG